MIDLSSTLINFSTAASLVALWTMIFAIIGS